MPLTGSTVKVNTLTSTAVSLTATNPTNGVGPYTVQWQRGLTPASFANVSGATSLTLNDTGLTPGVAYFYQPVFTDSTPTTPLTGSFPTPAIYTYHQERGSEGIVRKEYLVSKGRISGPARRR